MFTAQDIRDRVKQQPFRPVRIVTSAGDHWDIRHPDLVFVGRRDVMVGAAIPEDPEFYDRVTRVSILHITALEDLPPGGGGKEKSNGSGRRKGK